MATWKLMTNSDRERVRTLIGRGKTPEQVAKMYAGYFSADLTTEKRVAIIKDIAGIVD